MTSYWVALTLADAVDRLWASTTIAVPQPWAKCEVGLLAEPAGLFLWAEPQPTAAPLRFKPE